MQMSELRSPKLSATGQQDSAASQSSPARWQELFDQLSADVAGPLTHALELVQSLAASGRISRHDLRVLHEDVETARRAGVIGQQIVRLASGQARQVWERVDMSNALSGMLNRRSREADTRGLHISRILTPAEVSVDPALLSSLIDTMLDWVFSRARSAIELRIDMKTRPTRAELTCTFAERSGNGATRDRDAGGAASTNESLAWPLLEQTAATMGVTLQRYRSPSQTTLTLEFPPSTGHDARSPDVPVLDRDTSPPRSGKRLAGHQILVLVARDELRKQIGESIHELGLIIDYVESVDDAAAFCAEGLPHAIIFEAAQQGEHLEKLRAQICAEAPEFVFIEITEDGHPLELSSSSGSAAARIARDALTTALPSALVIELGKST
jgi:hypothetical protein